MMSKNNDLSAKIDLFVVSTTALFLELAFIRFINSTVLVVSYFNNFVILSAILGLGFGALLVSKYPKTSLSYFPTVAFLFTAMLVFLAIFAVEYKSPDQVAFDGWLLDRTLPFQFVIILVFVGNFLFFVPLGHHLGICLNRFENRLIAYNYDLLGSLAGVLALALMAYWRTEPWFWLVFAGIGVLYLLRHSRQRFLLALVAWGLTIIATLAPEQGIWSPYYKVTTRAIQAEQGKELYGYSVAVDRSRIQEAINFDADHTNSRFKTWLPYYRLPYLFRPPGSVLVLGGGSGNDTYVALANGAKSVHVVEIDPVLAGFGYTLHPQRPYLDPRVTVVNDDARTYLRQTDRKFDLVVMNALDSHLQLPGLSTLRLESYVYTKQAFQDARSRLAEDGILLFHLMSTRPWMGERLFWTLTEAFGKPPRLFATDGSPLDSIAFVYGPDEVLTKGAEAGVDGLRELDPEAFLALRGQVEVATDDWPHLYLAGRKIPDVYVYVLIVIVVLSLIALPVFGRVTFSVGNLHFFLLGASFMLLEARSLTHFALLFGSTWIVNAVVISAILFVVWLANLLILKGIGLPKRLCYGLLFASLIASAYLPLDFVLSYPFFVRVLVTALLIGTPIFFASTIFSYSFRRAEVTATAFGANLLGIVVGGSLEYASMIYGLNALYFLAVAMYVAAMLTDGEGLFRLRRLAGSTT